MGGRRLLGPLAPLLAAALGALACRGGGEAAEAGRVAELELRVARLEQRLAALPAGPADLQAAGADELLQRLDSPDPVVRWQAAAALAERSGEDRALLARLFAGGTDRQRRAAALALAGRATEAELPLLLLAHGMAERATDRALLVTALGRTRADGAVDAVVADLGHPSRKVRLAAVEALGSLGAARSALALLETVFADEPPLSELAAEAVRGLGPPALIFVEGAWPRWDPRQRRRALEVVGGLEGVEIVELLSERLDDADPLVALEAALQLARRGDDRARAAGMAFVGSADPVVARRAREVIDALERP